MNIEETHQNVNEIYSNNFKRIIKGFRDDNADDELSWDLEIVHEESECLGDLIDFLVENEKCTTWDTPYIIFLILNHPEKVYTYFKPSS